MSNEETKFKSPLPFMIQLRNLIFGERRPNWYTQLTFFLNLIAVFIFGLWSTISFFVIVYREVFFTQKGVDVSAIIDARGAELGYQPGFFLDRLTTFHGISMICWLLAFFGLILLWRQSRVFAWFFFGGTLFYFGMLVFYLGFAYYSEDTTSFDKVLFLAMMLQSFVYFLITHRRAIDEAPTFFG